MLKALKLRPELLPELAAPTSVIGVVSAAEVAESMSGEITRETEPIPAQAVRYGELPGIYRGIYPQLRETFARPTRFTARD